MKLPSDFRELLEEFAREGVEHVVIGGYAFAYHVEPRATKDLDIFLEGSADNRERAARALTRYGAPENVLDATKRAAARPQDLADLVKLERVRERQRPT